MDGHKPLRTRKVRYDEREPFRTRNAMLPPEQDKAVDAPPQPGHPWATTKFHGTDESKQLDLFKEQRGAIADKEAVAALAKLQGENDRTVAFMRDRDEQAAFS